MHLLGSLKCQLAISRLFAKYAQKQLENVKDIQKVIVHSVTDLANHYQPEVTLCD